MTLWHKSEESAKGSGLVVVKNGKNAGVMTAYEHRSQAPAGKWCYLTELLKLEQENKKLQEKLEITVKALDKIVNYNSVAEQVDKYHHIVIDVREICKEALAKIKEIG